MAEKHRTSQMWTRNHQYTLQNPCIHPNDSYRCAYTLNKRKLGAYTRPRTPNRGFHPIRMIPHPPRSPRTRVHDHKLSIVNSNTDTRAWGANDESPPRANTPLPGWMPGWIRSPPPSPICVHCSIEPFFLLFHFLHIHDLPYIHRHQVVPRQSYYLSPPASTDWPAICLDECTDQHRVHQ